MTMLFGKLPGFFKGEDELRKLWTAPDTHLNLLEALPKKASAATRWRKCEKIIRAEKHLDFVWPIAIWEFR